MEMHTNTPNSTQAEHVRVASHSVCGAREGNEDTSGTGIHPGIHPYYTYSFVCDGHGGKSVAALLGDAFDVEMAKTIRDLLPGAPADKLVQTLQACYQTAVEAVDLADVHDAPLVNEGATISATLLQLDTMVCATLTLGDSCAIAVDLSSGKLVQATVLLHIDDAVPSTTAMCAGGNVVDCVTTSHDFTNTREMQRYQSALCHGDGYSIRVKARRDALKQEHRVKAVMLNRKGVTEHQFVEPSRTVECMRNYSEATKREGVPHLQRGAEYCVWQLPTDTDVAVCVLCDGFVSKCAIPSATALARCVCDPGRYLDGDFLSGTVLGDWIDRKRNWWPRDMIKPGMDAWLHDPLRHTMALLRHIAPDDHWKDAIDKSFEAICQQAPHSDGSCCLARHPDRAAAMIANLPVLLGSDDNVTFEAIVVTR